MSRYLKFYRIYRIFLLLWTVRQKKNKYDCYKTCDYYILKDTNINMDTAIMWAVSFIIFSISFSTNCPNYLCLQLCMLCDFLDWLMIDSSLTLTIQFTVHRFFLVNCYDVWLHPLKIQKRIGSYETTHGTLNRFQNPSIRYQFGTNREGSSRQR